MLQPKQGHHQVKQYKILISAINMELYNDLIFSADNEISLYQELCCTNFLKLFYIMTPDNGHI
jgi:hypothetical protein